MDPEVNTKVTLKGEFIDHKKVECRPVAPMVVQVEELVHRKDPVTMEEEEGWIKFNLNTFNIQILVSHRCVCTFLTFYLQNCSASWQFWLRACSVGFLSVARQPEDGRHFYSLHK